MHHQSDHYFQARLFKKEKKIDCARSEYQAAIKSGDCKGYYGLAILAEENNDIETATELYCKYFAEIEQAALDGDSVAASIVGVYYALGLGELEQDSKLAHLWFLVGALGGDEVAQYNLAVHYYLGVVVKQNLAAARACLDAAIEKGYEPAITLQKELKNPQL